MKTTTICGVYVSEALIELMETTAEIFNIELTGGFIPKFYHDVLNDDFVSALILSEKEEGKIIKEAFKAHRQSNSYFPCPNEIINIIKILHGAMH